MSSNTYYVADYNRFSSKEDDSKESNSIQSQREINKAFIEELSKKYPDDTFIHIDSYSDDDFTGTNFNRPDFKRLKADCLSGKVNCIVVKDHSRFARNAAHMQIILEEDLEDVRYISKLDDFDSRFDDYDSMFQIRNTFNQMYAEDISRKVHSSIDSKQKQGLFLGSFTCYGYVKSKEDKHILEVDENVRYVVEMIFNLRLEGMNIQTIARYLNDKNILSPSEYKKSQGLKYKNPHSDVFETKQLWTFATVYRILINETYRGNLVQGRKRQKMRKKAKVKDKADWVVAKNACPAIISDEVFDEVQRLMKEAKHIKANTKKKENLFAGLIKCGECKHSMIKAQKKDETLYYACRTRKALGKQYCDNDYIRSDVLERIILDDLNSIIAEVKDLNSLIDESEIDTQKLNLEKQLNQAKTELERVVRKRRLSYSDYQDDIISKADYLHIKQESENRELALNKQIEELQMKILDYDITEQQSSFIQKLLETKQIQTLDRSIIQEMLETIYIYKDNHIKIVYKFANELEALKQAVSEAQSLAS